MVGMQRQFHRKLIRDHIPETIEKTGRAFKVRTLDEKGFEKALKKKLVEEAKELQEAPKNEVLHELADVLEITRAIADYYKFSDENVKQCVEEKKKTRGAYTKKLFLIWTEK